MWRALSAEDLAGKGAYSGLDDAANTVADAAKVI
jgi:hypothetical protein